MAKKKGADSVPDKKKYRADGRLQESFYESELARLQIELVKLHAWVREKG